MSLSCSCGDDDGCAWYFAGPSDFSKLETKRSRRCCSCGAKINWHVAVATDPSVNGGYTLCAAIAQGESEPVAWMDKQQGAFSFMGSGKYGPTWIPLYAAPQVADYVPLSDGQIYTAYIEASNQTLRPQDERIAIEFARAVERAVRGAK